jgi:hypothetical protein
MINVRPSPYNATLLSVERHMHDIDIYYESIRQVYSQIMDSRKRKTPLRERVVDWLLGLSVIVFLLSLIPILPTIAVFVGSQLGLTWGWLSLKSASIGELVVVWITSAIVSALVLALVAWINSKVDALGEKQATPQQTLSPEQLTFIATYEAFKDLKVYFVSHIDQHVDNSISALTRLFPTARHRLEAQEIVINGRLLPAEIEMMYLAENPGVMRSGRTSLSKQAAVAEAFLKTFEKYAWLQIDPISKSTLQALISFPEKVIYRLRKREDLPSALSVLESLSKFSYAYLPEHKTYMDAAALERVQSEGAECLKRFVQQVNEMTQYSDPVDQKQTKAEARITWLEKMRRSDYAAVLLRFTIWFVLLLLLTSLAVYGLSRQFTLSSDTIVTLIIGTSVAGATALTGILFRGSKSG